VQNLGIYITLGAVLAAGVSIVGLIGSKTSQEGITPLISAIAFGSAGCPWRS
jgi:hypothetical protein